MEHQIERNFENAYLQLFSIARDFLHRCLIVPMHIYAVYALCHFIFVSFFECCLGCCVVGHYHYLLYLLQLVACLMRCCRFVPFVGVVFHHVQIARMLHTCLDHT